MLKVKSTKVTLIIKIKGHYLGVYRERGTPVPIPNTEVKPLLADGT
jgi:hypothetical protein